MALTTERQFAESIGKSAHVLVTFRKEWTIDALATSLALARWIGKKGKRVDVVCDGFTPTKAARFLPGVDTVRPGFHQLQKFVIALDVSKTKIDELSYDLAGDKLLISLAPKSGQFDPKDVTTRAADYKYDLIVMVDTPDYASLGGLFAAHSDFFYHRSAVNIDHEPSNEQHGNINVVDITATSSAEVLFTLLKETKEPFLDEEVATCLLAGMISKTRSFKTASVTPKTLDIASELVAAGGRRDEVVQQLFRTRGIPTLKLWGRALARLKYDPALKMTWTLLVRQDFVHAGAEEEFLPDVIDELVMNSPDSEIAAILYEQGSPAGDGKVAGVCAIVATEKHASALGLVAGLRPDGTRKQARVCFPGANLIDSERRIVAAVAKALGKTPSTPHVAPEHATPAASPAAHARA